MNSTHLNHSPNTVNVVRLGLMTGQGQGAGTPALEREPCADCAAAVPASIGDASRELR
jgi:hypothetical protein